MKALTVVLLKYFTVSIEGQLSFVLGIELKYHYEEITRGQQFYISQVLECFGMDHCRPVTIPINFKLQLLKPLDNDSPVD